jgi:hypothetical protein
MIGAVADLKGNSPLKRPRLIERIESIKAELTGERQATGHLKQERPIAQILWVKALGGCSLISGTRNGCVGLSVEWVL